MLKIQIRISPEELEGKNCPKSHIPKVKQGQIVIAKILLLGVNNDLQEYHAIDLDLGVVFSFCVHKEETLNLEVDKSYFIQFEMTESLQSDKKGVKFKLLGFKLLKNYEANENFQSSIPCLFKDDTQT